MDGPGILDAFPACAPSEQLLYGLSTGGLEAHLPLLARAILASDAAFRSGRGSL